MTAMKSIGSFGLQEGNGDSCNRVRIGGITQLRGDKLSQPEKPYTIIKFPGGSVEVARTSDDNYWVHIATHWDGERPPGTIINARIDADARYADAANAALRHEIEAGGVKHIAFLVSPAVTEARHEVKP